MPTSVSPGVPRSRLNLLAAAAVLTLVLQSRPIHDLDLFWQVKTGQWLVEHGRLGPADPFSALHADRPIELIGWLAQVFCAGLYRLGSWRLVHQASAVALAAGLVVAAWPVRRRLATRDVLIGLGLGLLVVLPHADTRPQNFAVLGFAALLALERSRLRFWKKAVLAGAVLVAWQNLHPSVVVGAAALGAVVAARWLRAIALARRAPIHRGRDTRTPTRPHERGRCERAPWPWQTTFLALMAAAATLATPMGTAYFATASYNAWIARHLGVSEWTPWWEPTVWRAKATAWAALLVSLALLARVRRKARLEELATLAVMTALALPAYRMSLFWAVALVPVWSRWAGLAMPCARASRSGDAVVPRFAAIAVLGVLAAGALGLPWTWRAALFDAEVPLAGVERLRALGVQGVVYNYREWSGPLLWFGHPDWKVTIDGRLYRYDPDDWRDYQRAAQGLVPPEEIDRRFHPAAFFLRPGFHAKLIDLLRGDPGWVEAYRDGTAAIFVRTGPPAAERLAGPS